MRVILAGVVLAVVWAALWSPCLMDDAFIAYSYGRDAAAYTVEGYTSAAWVALAAIAHRVDLHPLVMARCVSALLVFALAYALRRTPCVAAAVLASPGVWLHSAMGLETTAYASVCAALWLWLTRCDPEPIRVGLALVGLALLRPEGVAVGAAVLLVQAMRGNPCARAAAVALAVGGAYFVARWWYWGALLPTPFHMKAGGMTLATYVTGAKHWQSLWLLAAWAWWASHRCVFAVAIGVSMLAPYLFVAPIMGWAGRFMFPLALLLLVSMAAAPRRLRVALLAVVVLTAPMNAYRWWWIRDQGRKLMQCHGAIAARLDGGEVWAADAGVISYYGRARLRDVGGLMSPKPTTAEGCRWVVINTRDVLGAGLERTGERVRYRVPPQWDERAWRLVMWRRYHSVHGCELWQKKEEH